MLLVIGLAWGPAAMADSVYVIDHPEVDFQVIDVDDPAWGFVFDGVGDIAFESFGDVVQGTFGAARSIVEYDISGFTVPAGEVITGVKLEIRCSSPSIQGFGVNEERPDSLAVDGFVGNGMAEASDFQIADGNQLATADSSNLDWYDIVEFSIPASYVAGLVNAGDDYLGLTVRAETFGGCGFWEYPEYPYPRLTITTGVPEPGTAGLCLLGGLALLRRRRDVATKRRRHGGTGVRSSGQLSAVSGQPEGGRGL
jgi:hypothetical protein